MSEITNPTLDRARVPGADDSVSDDVLNPPLSTDVGLSLNAETIQNPPLDIDSGRGGGIPDSLRNPPFEAAGPADEFGLAHPVRDTGELEQLFERRVSEAALARTLEESPVPGTRASPTSDEAPSSKKSASKRTSARRRETGT